MLSKMLMAASAAIVLILGCIHLVYTFWGPALLPRDPGLQIAMSQVHLGITTETTVWRAWIGFNASHSMGAMLFGLVFGYLALTQPRVLFGSPFLLAVGFLMLAGFFLLAKAYWFSVPFAGISVAAICYIASVICYRE